jgi:5'-nucleotidase
MIIYLDMDGTTVDLDHVWLAEYNRDYNDKLTREDLREYDIEAVVKTECGDKIFDYLHRKDIYFRAPFFEGAEEAIHALRLRGNDLYFATAPYVTEYVYWDKIRWVRKHFPELGAESLIFCPDKSLLRGDALVDDYYGHLERFKGHRILIDRSWNRHLDDGFLADRNIIRLQDWGEITDFLLGL